MRVCQFRHFGPSSVSHNTSEDAKSSQRQREITRLVGKTAERGLTLVPLRLYFKGGRAKVELGLARGRKLHDKRAAIREREVRREMDKAARAGRRGAW